MQTWMTLQSKILKTKKKLSSPWQHQVLISFAIFTTFAALSYALHGFNLSWPHGLVLLDIPVVLNENEIPENALELVETSTLNQESLVVAITESAIFWGQLSAFTDDYYKKNNKYIVPHLDQRPNLISLLENLQKWKEDEKQTGPEQAPLVIIASSVIPMPIIIQTVAALREHGGFQQVVLGDGLL